MIIMMSKAHYEAECSEYPVRCERCSESVKKNFLEEHHDRHCPYVECLCHEMVRRILVKSQGQALEDIDRVLIVYTMYIVQWGLPGDSPCFAAMAHAHKNTRACHAVNVFVFAGSSHGSGSSL